MAHRNGRHFAKENFKCILWGCVEWDFTEIQPWNMMRAFSPEYSKRRKRERAYTYFIFISSTGILAIIGPSDGLSFIWREVIACTNANLLSVGLTKPHLNEIHWTAIRTSNIAIRQNNTGACRMFNDWLLMTLCYMYLSFHWHGLHYKLIKQSG